MDTPRECSRAAALTETQLSQLGENGVDVTTRKPRIKSRTTWHEWHGGAVLVTLLVAGMLFLGKRCLQSVQAAPTTTPQAEEAQNEHTGASEGAPTKDNTGLMPNAEHRMPQENSTAERPLWSSAPILPLLPFSSQNALVHTAWAERAASRTRGHKPKQAGPHTGYKQVGAEQLLQELRDADAEDKEHEQVSEELQAQCTQLKLDCSLVKKLVSQHLRKNSITWTATTRAAVSTALKKIAELVHEVEHRQAVDGAPVPTDLHGQRRRLTLQAQRLLEAYVADPLQSSSLYNNIHELTRTEEHAAGAAQATNHLPGVAKDEEIEAKTAESGHVTSLATADESALGVPAESVRGVLNTADKEKFWAQQAGAGNGKVPWGNAVDAEVVHVLLGEAIDSLKHNPALQQLLVLPVKRKVRGAVVENDGKAVTGEHAEEDAQTNVIQENERRPGDVGNTQSESEPAEVPSGSVRSEEDTTNNTSTVITSNNSRVVAHPRHPLLFRPHRTVYFLTRAAAQAPEQQNMGLRRALTVGELETLLQSRVQQRHRRRSPSRPLIFPSCYFDAPMQKRMREKASVLAASLEQLNDAVEALTELGILVEKQAELVEKAAFTLVYRDRLVGESKSPPKPRVADDFDGEEKRSEMQAEQYVENLGGGELTQTGNHPSPTEIFTTTPAESADSTVDEKERPASVSEQVEGAATEATASEAHSQSPNLQIDEDKYKKLVGANGVRKQLRELFASWELARRAAGASEMANEIMRRAETLRRGFVLPLQQDLHQLNLLDATLSPNHVALQRLVGCKGFINAVRRTVARAEEELYNLGAHAFASEVSLPLMAHDLQHHLADLLEHVVQLQLQHHRALHVRAASLISLHREFFRSARELQQEATARLKDSHLLLSTSAEEWQEMAQHLSVSVFQLRVDLARQLVALRSVDKKAARLEGILNLLQGGLEHLLHVEVQLQEIRKNSRMRDHWPVLDEEEEKDDESAQKDANGKPAEELVNDSVPPGKEGDADAAGLKSRNAQHVNVRGPARNVFPRLQAGVADADEALSLELPPKIQGGSLGTVGTGLVGEASERDGDEAMKILQRLLGGVVQMAEFLKMYKQQSRDAEQLLRNRFHIAQESVQKATGVAYTIMAQPVALVLKQQEQKLRDKIPPWRRSTQRQGLASTNPDEGLKESADLVRQVNEKVRSFDAAVFAFEDPSLEENHFTGRDVVARIDRINNRLFTKLHPKQGIRSAIVGPFCAWNKKSPLPKTHPQKTTQKGQ